MELIGQFKFYLLIIFTYAFFGLILPNGIDAQTLGCGICAVGQACSNGICVDSVPSGWNNNLTHRCVKSVDPQGQNYFQDLTDCAGGKNWTIAVESEKNFGVTDPGPVDQSFLVNGPNSPVTMNWLKHTDESGNSNWSAELKTDLSQYTHPSGAGYFTWVAFMDHVDHNGGPLPRPDQLSFSSTVNYNDFTPNGASRAIVGFQGYWNGKSHLVEINFSQTNWGDARPEADVINYEKSATLEFINLDGAAMGIAASKMKETKLIVFWSDILINLTARGLIENPDGGWKNSATQTVFIATEVNNFTATNSVIADLWFTNFHVEQTMVDTCGPSDCASINYACGSTSDGCGGVLSCGICNNNQVCINGQCVTGGGKSGSDGGGSITVAVTTNTTNANTTITKPVAKMTRVEILAKVEEIKKLLIQLIAQLIVELQKQLVAMPK